MDSRWGRAAAAFARWVRTDPSPPYRTAVVDTVLWVLGVFHRKTHPGAVPLKDAAREPQPPEARTRCDTRRPLRDDVAPLASRRLEARARTRSVRTAGWLLAPGVLLAGALIELGQEDLTSTRRGELEVTGRPEVLGVLLALALNLASQEVLSS